MGVVILRTIIFYRAIQKYGWNNFEHEVIAENLTKDEACEMEKALIKKLKSNDYHFGYNLSAGGEGNLGLSGFKSPTFIDLTGQRFGKLTVLKYDESSACSEKGTRWICRCDCGNIVSRLRVTLQKKIQGIHVENVKAASLFNTGNLILEANFILNGAL